MKPLLTLLAFCCISAAETFNRDLYEALAIDAENREDFNASAEYNRIIYEKTSDRTNRDRQIEALLRAERYNDAILEARKGLLRGDTYFLRRVLAIAYYGKRDMPNAIGNAKILTRMTRQADDYILLGDFYLIYNENRNAFNAYQKAYLLSYSETAIDKMAAVLVDRLRNEKDAIAYYETHIVERGCSEYLCMRLASLYAKGSNAGGVASAYKRVYKLRPDPTIGQKIVELYLMDKNYKRLIKWLEETSFNDEILLELYRNEKRFKKAAKIALALYKKSEKIDYLALSAMFEYESGDANNQALIKKTVQSLEKVVAVEKNHIYLNYLGYLLIDHDVDIERGIAFVVQALKIDPNNLYYADSLAWGHYKMGRYKEAYELIAKVAAKENKDSTVIEHYNKIKESYEQSLIESKK
jgi:tetratricopeptide (TPR) repeat protein